MVTREYCQASVQTVADLLLRSGTCDISIGNQTQSNPENNLSNGVQLALCLKNSWDTSNAGGSKSPAIPTAKNAGSYPAFATGKYRKVSGGSAY